MFLFNWLQFDGKSFCFIFQKQKLAWWFERQALCASTDALTVKEVLKNARRYTQTVFGRANHRWRRPNNLAGLEKRSQIGQDAGVSAGGGAATYFGDLSFTSESDLKLS